MLMLPFFIEAFRCKLVRFRVEGDNQSAQDSDNQKEKNRNCPQRVKKVPHDRVCRSPQKEREMSSGN